MVTEREKILSGIGRLKKNLGKDVLILAHYYQHEDITRFADFTGDSLQLAEQATQHKDIPFIICCAVSFMAETIRILCSSDQVVLSPELRGGCSMADMARTEQAEDAFAELKKTGRKIIPVTYVNSSASLKAFCGRREGFACTSANAKKIFQYILSGGASVLFFPDRNLGLNTSYSLGIKDHEIFLWEPGIKKSEIPKDALQKSRIFLWNGYCGVHTAFMPSDINNARDKEKGIKVIVHPECTPETVALSDLSGSTGFMKTAVEKSDAESKWAIGTEINFVNMIREQNPDKFILPLKTSGCAGMAGINAVKLFHVLKGLSEGKLYGRVTIENPVAENAGYSLKRMLETA